MPNWAQAIITLVNNAGADWTKTTPVLAEVKFPRKVSRDFLINPAMGALCKNMK